MFNITVANYSGFCYGVDKAVKKVYNELSVNTHVATLGPIIHNKDVVNDMEKHGARIINDIAELQNDETVVIRSHGVGRHIYDEIEKKGNRIIDATCPFVSRIHKIVAEKTLEGFFILIAGDKNHPEVQGIVGHCDENCLVFKDNFELKAFFEKKYKNLKKRLAIVSQTTYNIIMWDMCLKEIPKDDPNVVIFDTICNSTETRQREAENLARKSDLMIVVGGKHSSNTVKLFDVCSKHCKTYHIENAGELLTLKIPYAENIGITAGASTPAHIIKEVKTTMTEILKDNLNEEIFNEEMIDQSFKKIHTRDRVTAVVESVNANGILVSLGAKQTGFVALADLTDDPAKKPSDIVSVGDEIELIVTKVNDQDGIVNLSKKKLDEQAGFDKVIKAKEDATVLEAVVKNVVKGGVLVSYNGVKIFIPASLTGLPRNADLEQLMKKKVQFVVIEADENHRRRAVGSMRAVTDAQKEEAKAKFWAVAKIGDVFTGKVKSITSFGAFVDIGGIDGMVHISELSWKRIKHPSEVVSIGDTLEVYIKDLNQEENRISLGYKKAEDNPWTIFKEKYAEGDVVTVTIVSITSFGAFARIIDGIDGLIHISQLADRKVESVKEVLSVGQEVEAKIISVDFDAKRVSLSIRELSEETAEDAE